MSLTRRTLLCLCGLAARPHPAPPTCCRAACHRPPISPVPRTGLAAFGSCNLGCPPDSPGPHLGSQGTGCGLEKPGLHGNLLLTAGHGRPFWGSWGLALP